MAEAALPELPEEWTWDWSTVNLSHGTPQSDEDEAQLSDDDRDHL